MGLGPSLGQQHLTALGVDVRELSVVLGGLAGVGSCSFPVRELAIVHAARADEENKEEECESSDEDEGKDAPQAEAKAKTAANAALAKVKPSSNSGASAVSVSKARPQRARKSPLRDVMNEGDDEEEAESEF